MTEDLDAPALDENSRVCAADTELPQQESTALGERHRQTERERERESVQERTLMSLGRMLCSVAMVTRWKM